MLKEELLRLIKQRETEDVELKSSLSKPEEIVEAVSGLSNTKGGKILIGVSNTGKILGVKIGKDTIERLTNKIAQNTDPKVQPRISMQEINKKNIIVIDVKESMDKLVLAFGRPYKRVGKSTVKMSKDEYERLILEKHKEKLRFNNQICEEASLEDIDQSTVNWFIERYEFLIGRRLRLSGMELIKSLGCLAKIGEEVRLTNAGVLLFGKNPQKFYPNSRVTVVVYPGRSVGTKHIDLRDFEGTLFKIIDDVDDFIKKNIHTYSYLKKKQVPRESIPQYPYFVTRELLGMDLNERQKKIIKFIEENRRITTSQCVHLLNVSKDTAFRELLKLRSLGLVEQKGIGRGIYYTIK